jgi:hypothetical protein
LTPSEGRRHSPDRLPRASPGWPQAFPGPAAPCLARMAAVGPLGEQNPGGGGVRRRPATGFASLREHNPVSGGVRRRPATDFASVGEQSPVGGGRRRRPATGFASGGWPPGLPGGRRRTIRAPPPRKENHPRAAFHPPGSPARAVGNSVPPALPPRASAPRWKATTPTLLQAALPHLERRGGALGLNGEGGTGLERRGGHWAVGEQKAPGGPQGLRPSGWFCSLDEGKAPGCGHQRRPGGWFCSLGEGKAPGGPQGLRPSGWFCSLPEGGREGGREGGLVFVGEAVRANVPTLGLRGVTHNLLRGAAESALLAGRG